MNNIINQVKDFFSIREDFHFVSKVIFLCVFCFPITYLSIRGSVHIPLIIIALSSLLLFAASNWRATSHLAILNKKPILISLSLSSLFLAVGLSQIIRGDFNASALDGPSKLLLAALAIPLLNKLNISYSRILEVGIGVGLILLLATLSLKPETSAAWGGRFATKFVDPNSLGSQTMILASICLLTIPTSPSKLFSLFKIFTAIIGFYVSIHAGSRGGWLAFPFLIGLFFLLNWHSLKNNIAAEKRIPYSIILLAVILFAILTLFNFLPNFSNRLVSGYHEIMNWLSGKDLNGSAGIRLSMWKVAILLSQDSLIAGFGEKDLASILNGHILNTPAHSQAIRDMIEAGPHSDILSKLLSMGLLGLSAYLATIIIPWVYFWKRRHNTNINIRLSSHMGLYLTTGFLICGLSNEMMSLKYLCSFYGLMIAVLSSQNNT
jgi:O-antigen ligase